MKLNDRVYKCECGHRMDRDLNSAFNIMNRYLLGLSHPLPKWDVPEWINHSGNLDIDTFVYV